MKTEEKLKDLIKIKYGSLRKFCNETGIPQSTLSTIMVKGINNASIRTIIKICQALDISTDELAEGRVIPNNHKERQSLRLLAYARELTNILQLGREYKNAYEPYAIDGVDMDAEETEMFLDGIELLTNLIRKQRLRKEMQMKYNHEKQADREQMEMEL